MAYIYDIADTWNASGTTFKGIALNVTDTASAAGSLLMDLQVGGSSKFNVTKAGVIGGSGYYLQTSALSSFNGRFAGGSDGALGGANGAAWSVGGALGFTTLNNATGVNDLKLERDAANTLAQRNGVNAQAFNLYNTYTDASNYERGFMRFVSNVLEIGSEALGTGTVRNLIFKVGTTTSLTLNTGGAVSPSFQVGAGGVAAAGYSVNGNASTGLSWPASGRAILFSNINAGEGTVTLNAFNSGFALNEAGNILSARYSSSLNDIALGITTQLSWVDAANSRTGAPDTGLKRNSAGVVKVTNGSTGTGQLIFIVPTTNPGITGALWNNAGTLAIS